MTFKLWLEFEQFEPSESWDADNEFFNMKIELSNGKQYAFNVWSYSFAKNVIDESKANNRNFEVSPDLLVLTCTREHMIQVVDELIRTQALKPEWEI